MLKKDKVRWRTKPKLPPTDVSGKNSGRRGRIENLRPWKSGQSGNPKGCPPKAVRLSAILEEHLEKISAEDAKKRPWKELFVEAVVKAAMKGNGTAIREIFDRIDGKVPLPLRHSGDKGGSLLEHMSPEQIRNVGTAVLACADHWKDDDTDGR